MKNILKSVGAKRRVLIVEDERINREILGNILMTEYEVVYAENGQQAITVTVENKCEGKIKLRKTEEGSDQPVAGAVYGLFSDEDCLNLIYTFPETDGNGETETADKYPCGEQFYVKEIEAPASYELSDTIYPVTIEAKEDGEIAYVLAVTDKKLPTRIQVIKVDEKSNPLAGVQLQILDSSGNIIIPTCLYIGTLRLSDAKVF